MNSRMTGALLAVSLAFNIFLVGAAVGGAFVWFTHTQPKPEPPARGVFSAAQSLPQDKRDDFRKALRQARKSVAGRSKDGRKARENLARLLVQEPLDRAAIDARLEAIRDADDAVRARVEAAIIEFAATLTPAQREKLVKALATRGQMLRGIGKK